MNNIEYIFIDNNSTTQIDSRVLDAMLPILKENYANPSSTHHFGRSINEKVKQSRERIANFLNAESNELIFTSGATEAINIAIKGIAESYSNKGKHIITVSTEHKAVLDTCKDLERKGFELTYLSVTENGLIDLEELNRSIRPDTILVSVMYVNNETGVIQPIKEIAAMAHQKGVLFMTDATQAVGKIDIDVDDLGIDLLCFSGHKFYGPNGIGVLFINRRGNEKIKILPLVHGGGHEQGLRSGTLNAPGIIALSKACEIANEEMTANKKQILLLRDKLESELLKLPNTSVNGDKLNRIYNTTNISFKGEDANVLIGRMKNIAVSNGSACTSAIIESSYVLKAMGLNDEEAFSSIRFSLGKYNTEDEIKNVVIQLKQLIQTN